MTLEAARPHKRTNAHERARRVVARMRGLDSRISTAFWMQAEAILTAEFKRQRVADNSRWRAGRK